MSVLRPLAVVAVISLGLGACSGDSADEPTTTLPAETTIATTTTTTTEPPEIVEEVGEPELLWTVELETRPNGLALDPGGDLLAVAEDATYLYQLADGQLVDAVVYTETGVGYPEDLAYASSGEVLVAGLHVSHNVITGASGDVVLVIPGSFNNRVALGGDDRLLATSDRSGVVVLRDVELSSESADLVERFTLPAPDIAGAGPMDASVLSLDFHPDGSLLAVVHWSGLARLIDTVTGNVVVEWDVNGEGQSAEGALLRFSPDGRSVAGAVVEQSTQQIVVWDVDALVASGDPGAPSSRTNTFDVLERVRDLHFSPDGDLLVVASRLGTTIWDPSVGEVRFTFPEEFDATATQQPLAARFTPDGGHVAIARGDRTVELWRLPGAEVLIAPERPVCDPIPVPGDVLFDTGSAVLRPEADAVLAVLAGELADTFDTAQLTFVGHTDSRGSADANRELSIQRADAVREWFAEWASENGIESWTLAVDGRGDTELKVNDIAADGSFLAGAGQLNRRVEIEIDAIGC